MERVTELLSMHPLEWCWPCARAGIQDAQEKYKIFAYLFLLYANEHKDAIQDATTFEAVEDTFIITMKKEIFENWDIEFYERERFMAKYYKFLYWPIREHFLKWAQVGLNPKMGYAFRDGDLIITVRCK